VCGWVREREGEYMCVRERDREREREKEIKGESVWVGARERG